jgi:hypothetical protein
MRTRAVWLLGLLASVNLGSLLGLSLWQAGLGSAAWGVAAGALTFACFRPWPSVANTAIGTDVAPPPSNASSLALRAIATRGRSSPQEQVPARRPSPPDDARLANNS